MKTPATRLPTRFGAEDAASPRGARRGVSALRRLLPRLYVGLMWSLTAGTMSFLRLAVRCFPLLLFPVLLAPGCGYVVGGAYAPEIRTVHVPTFTNETYRRGIELQLTEAVQKRIQDHTPYRLAPPYEADTRLVGRIIDIRKRVVNQNEYDDPRELEFQLAIEVRWEDARSGQVLATRDVPLDPNAAHLVSNPSFAPETGQSLATATQDAVDDLAREIVGMMEASW